ncbi:serine carboxypeptidase-like 40 isoform X1 [Neltuma alba]|uniref:serine carboxypeptidase-like 40 isoform X1 n=1 Tax=Neltuma alba TaxID=207710 RepID=UPI0010A2F7FF|nr:serine carboxypeptidase-like 40 isoform X1 [Prosopis alba]
MAIMEKETWWVLFLLSTLLLFVDEIHGSRKQEQALKNLNKANFKGGGSIDRSSNTILEVDEAVFGDSDDNKSRYYYVQEGLKEKDRIQKLPGQPEDVSISQYGGYVTVDKIAGRAFYYYFVEAQPSHRHKLPLLLWLNGGPGCSSLGYGAMQELGPFRVNSDGKTLQTNKYAWNYAVNVLFLESPAGVGFSYSNKTSDYDNNGDRRTATDNYVFVRNWLERFAEYKNSDFYIAGESYAGHYIPQLAHTIVCHNNHPHSSFLINLKGILIGNAVINDDTDNRGRWDFLASHAIISDKAAHAVSKLCDFSEVASSSDVNNECKAASNEIEQDIGSINIYNIYAPQCQDSNLTSLPKPPSKVADPCIDYYVDAYMNRVEVQEALHANVTKLSHNWGLCSDVITKWNDSASTVLPLLREFLNHRLRVWIFSGDFDGMVPVTSTKYSIEKLNLTLKTMWRPWFVNGEVGGYTETYKGGLTFATVRGAGHEVPSYQPGRALSLVNHFLKGITLPNSTTSPHT